MKPTIFQVIKRKLSGALKTLKDEGPYSVARLLLLNILEDRWLLGKVVEWRGNSATLDNSIFCLRSPYIATKLKSRFLIGSWEGEARYLIKKYLPRDLPVVELGACIGVV